MDQKKGEVSQPKKIYTAPTVTVHGDVEKLTENGATGASDGALGTPGGN